MLTGSQSSCRSPSRESSVLQYGQHCELSTVVQMQTVFHTNYTQTVSLLKFKTLPRSPSLQKHFHLLPTCVFPVVQPQILASAVLPLALLAAERLLSFVPPGVRLKLFCRGEPHQTAVFQAHQATKVGCCLVLAELRNGLKKLSTILLWASHWQGHLWFSTGPKLTALQF